MKGLQWIENETLREILDHMCCIAYVDPARIDFKSSTWFVDFTWTHKDQELFKQWMLAYLQDKKKGKKRIKDITKWSKITTNKKEMEKLIDWFLIQYGFRCI